MPYSRELLDSARSLLHVDPETQATLRRAVSTAYYSLFHFLIEEACGNRGRPEQRGRLARIFDHKNMLGASNRRVDRYKNAPPASNELYLRSVAHAFGQLQKQRHYADYDLSRTLSSGDVAEAILLAEEAFRSWDAIRNEQIAQDYLFSLLFKERT